ncbi:MAG: hypothetical protein ABFD07_20155 [Methanobacterium sp.]
MKYFAGLAIFLISFAANAETYMVFHYNQTTRVVLTQGSCLVNGLSGNRAAIQRDDGRYLRGCWKYVDNDLHIRIDWENPAKPGDFAVLRVRDFVPVSD